MKGPIIKVERDLRRRRIVLFSAVRRRALKSLIHAELFPELQRAEYQENLDAFPRNSSHTRIRNRCMITGRPNGTFRFVRLSRHLFKNYALAGLLFGVRKSSW